MFALKYTTAQTVARKIVDELICRHGVPKQILTDQGKNFQSMLLELINEYLGIKSVTSNHPIQFTIRRPIRKIYTHSKTNDHKLRRRDSR